MTTPVVRTLDITDTGMGMVDNIEAVRLQAIHRVRTLLGEWFLDVLQGIPRELVFSQRVTIAQATSVIAEELRKIRHVVNVEVTMTELNRANRQFLFSATLDTDFSESTTVEVTT